MSMIALIIGMIGAAIVGKVCQKIMEKDKNDLKNNEAAKAVSTRGICSDFKCDSMKCFRILECSNYLRQILVYVLKHCI
jgi:hypothetical protein